LTIISTEKLFIKMYEINEENTKG